LPPIGIRHCCCREKADNHAVLKGFYFLQAHGGSSRAKAASPVPLPGPL
jgi:hypothetical protein